MTRTTTSLLLPVLLMGACADYARYGSPSGDRRDGSARIGSGGAGAGGDGGNAQEGSAPPDSGGKAAFHDAGPDVGRPEPDATPDANPPRSTRDAMVDAGWVDDGKPFDRFLTFDSFDSMNAFEFRTADPYSGGPGDWVWATGKDGNGRLLQTTDVTVGIPPARFGTYAVYDRGVIGDGSVSVRVQSLDDDTAGIVLRYQDDFHGYFFDVNELTWLIARGDGPDSTSPHLTTLLCGGACLSTDPVAPNSGSFGIDWSAGHTMRFEAHGARLSAYLDGVLLGTVDDDTYASGRVALMTRALQGAYFDDMRVIRESAADL